MRTFCRIIELPETQVLLYLDENTEDETTEVVVMMDFGDMTSRKKYGFEDEDKAKKMLSEYTKEDAAAEYANQYKLFGED